jgi:hypothetical protein
MEADIMPYVQMGQDMYVEPKLGTFLTEKLTGTAFLSTIETELKNYYVKPLLLHSTIYLYGRDCNFKFTNRGVNKQFSDTSTPADLDEIIFKTNGQKDILENYTNRLLRYIDENRTSLGLNGVSCDDGPAKNSFNFGGIYVPTDRPRVYNTRNNEI